uniref:uncharacterized protein LOC122598161 n=1 Tax=Erigeron canadensis TaxID=72917 RepID=UPI001CB8D68A|nr:uncharacterized protein LOC122598161 [Erigeron canadensis]
MRMRTQIAPSVAPISSCCCSTSSSSSSSTSNGGNNHLLGGSDPQDDDQHWRNFDNSVSAVSFGLVATAILISMFLVMALFERFFRPPSSAAVPPSNGRPHESHHGKLEYPSPKVNIYAREVSVLMPGEENPTYIANPVPSVCPP